MSQITEFFINDGTDHRHRTLEDWLSSSDNSIEASHDKIQWIFPLHEISFHSTNSPVLTPDDIEELQSSETSRDNVKRALIRFTKFLGILAPANEKRQKSWCHTGNHNLLRITRAIRSLRLFGLEKQAQKFHEVVTNIGKQYNIAKNTFSYWDDAMNADLYGSMTKRFLDEREIKL